MIDSMRPLSRDIVWCFSSHCGLSTPSTASTSILSTGSLPSAGNANRSSVSSQSRACRGDHFTSWVLTYSIAASRKSTGGRLALALDDRVDLVEQELPQLGGLVPGFGQGPVPGAAEADAVALMVQSVP